MHTFGVMSLFFLKFLSLIMSFLPSKGYITQEDYKKAKVMSIELMGYNRLDHSFQPDNLRQSSAICINHLHCRCQVQVNTSLCIPNQDFVLSKMTGTRFGISSGELPTEEVDVC